MPRKIHDGLKKRCTCPKRAWTKCAHPWHFSFHHDDREYRFSLAKFVTTNDGTMSKSEAEGLRDTLRGEIRNGLRTTTGDRVTVKVDPAAPVTFGDVLDKFVTYYTATPGRRPSAIEKTAGLVRQLGAVQVEGAHGVRLPLLHKAIGTVTKADIEAIREARRMVVGEGKAAAERLAGPDAGHLAPDERRRLVQLASIARRSEKGGAVAANRLLALTRRVFNWAIAEGYITETPFRRHGVAVVKLDTTIEYARSRRLEADEEARLLQAASSHLRAVVECALSTGMRIGEILNLRWQDVRVDAAGVPKDITLQASKTKTSRTRVLPVGGRLRAVLEMRKLDAEGEPHSPDAYVFGHVETGERVKSVKTAWRLTCRRAGISGLHLHDLRRSFASALLESQAGLHDVAAFLGHSSVNTTARYLSTTSVRLRAAIDRMEGTEDDPPAAGTFPPQLSTSVN